MFHLLKIKVFFDQYLYEQVNQLSPSRAEIQEEKMLRAIRRHGELTAAQVANQVRGVSTTDAQSHLGQLVEARVLVARETKRTTYYRLPEQEGTES